MKDSTKDAIASLTAAAVLITATALAAWFGWRKIGAVLLIITMLLVGGLWQWLRNAMWRDTLRRK